MKKQLTQIISPSIENPPFEYLAPLFYFQVFSHPLSLQEVCKFSQTKGLSLALAETFLKQGVQDRLLFFKDGYYLLEDKPEWIDKREENEERAERYLRRTRRITHLIRRFPFVEAIFISGSTSKGVVNKGGDVDYFIITKPNRLWLTRTLLILFKKVFLLNSHRYFCINYLIDTDHLEIEEKNRFTATEIATLLPVFDSPYYQDFWKTNSWIDEFYPNAERRKSLMLSEMPSSRVKRFFEKIFEGSLGEQLDIWAMQLNMKRWRRKFKHMDKKRFDVALKSRPYVSKHHPQDFQSKVTKAFLDKVKAFEQKHGFLFKPKEK